MPDETFTSANDSYAIEGLAQQIVLEARSDWAGIFALTGALGYGAGGHVSRVLVRAPVLRPILPNLLARLSQLRCSSMRTLHDSRMQWLKKFVPRRQISRLVLG
ncbi:uncharacterized protein PADG_08159 [Paracoccidioides brasiliensis Pb18]|uniref:Uncharacterized protein n=1 Tax=Paracoccidioides brasiliensis (strain Pb18) TaxID=502780 RepID=C1GM73_PARBD|nr:uncharacterized protein PADG_08159 [Paracoccidioides brasiliensis Pb18]EEH43539.2 hypothetical protein PADG_08159 [Paracoccidioides brasiliensis Pb18]